jgi:hypothetical protein
MMIATAQQCTLPLRAAAVVAATMSLALHSHAQEATKSAQALPATDVSVPVINETAVLLAPSPTLSPTFGMVNGISADRIVVTGPEVVRMPGVAGQLATFVLSPTGAWEAVPEMLAMANCGNGDLIMGRVAFAGTALCVTHERRDGSNSLVEVFEPSPAAAGWIAAGAPLGPPGGAVEPAFGSAIATDGRYIAVSCVDQRVLGEKARIVSPSPKVFLFKAGPSGWSGLGFLQREVAKDPKFFGASLAMTPGRLVIGCPKAIQPAPKQPLVEGGDPVVCVWSESNGAWSLEAELAPPAGTAGLGFGQVVAASERYVVVRSSYVTTPGADVFVYRKADAGWEFDGALALSADATKGPAFGASLAAGEDFIVLGDPSADFPKGKGIVAVFVRTPQGWVESARLVPTVKTMSARWGVSIKVDGRRVLVAHPASERDGIAPGGSILFTLAPLTEMKVPDVKPTATSAVDVPLGGK